MENNKTNLEKFKVLYKKYYRKEINNNEALDELSSLLSLVKILLSNPQKIWK